MKKRGHSLIALLLALIFTLLVVPVSAEPIDDGMDMANFFYNGKNVASAARIIEGEVMLPKAPKTIAGFCGWYANVDGTKLFYPAGATVTGLSGDVDFEAVTVSFITNPGAQLRFYEGNVGLRFTSTILTADYEALVDVIGGADKIVFGTYIVPERYVTETKGTFTLEALAKKYRTRHVDVVAGGFYSTDETTSTIAGSIYGFLKGNYTLSYTAVGYMKLTYSNGEVGTVYAQYNQTKNSCNLLGTVLEEHDDRDESYPNLVVEALGSTHSKYTLEELDVMSAFLDEVIMVKFDTNYRYFALSTDYYTSPWIITFSSDENEINYIYAQPPEGKSLNDAKGIYLDGLSISLKRAVISDGKLMFEHDSYVWVG